MTIRQPALGAAARRLDQRAQLRLLLRRRAIERRVQALGRQITRDFRGQRVLLIAVLKGAAIFLADLIRHIHLDVGVEFMAVSSYGSGDRSSGEVRLTKDLDMRIEGHNVILVEDILDTGLTLSYLKKLLLAHQPACLKVATLLDKECRRVQPLKADYVGFTIPDEFVVGYGMDYAEKYRNLPEIRVLPPELL